MGERAELFGALGISGRLEYDRTERGDTGGFEQFFVNLIEDGYRLLGLAREVECEGVGG